MTEYVDTFIKCWQCRGTGTRPPDGEGGAECPYCFGAGKLHYGHLDVTAMNDKLNDIMNKLDDIFEKVNE